MKAETIVPKKTAPQKQRLVWADVPQDNELPNPPLERADTPRNPPTISQREIVAFVTALQIFQLARADFEAKRAALVMKLLQICPCEEGQYFALLDEQGNITVEAHTSLEPGTNRPVIDREIVPCGGPA
jgi:hypothetical protein